MNVNIIEKTLTRIGRVRHSQIVKAVGSDRYKFVKQYIGVGFMIKFWIPPDSKNISSYNRQCIGWSPICLKWARLTCRVISIQIFSTFMTLKSNKSENSTIFLQLLVYTYYYP